VLRTFSKIYGLAGLRVGYAVAPSDVCGMLAKLRRPFDVTIPAQEAALASIGDTAEIARRRALNAEGRAQLEAILRRHGLEPAPGAVANFVFVEVGDRAQRLADELLREGVIVRPLTGFGAPGALRISVGSPDENEFLDDALGRVVSLAL
jgi:histidinol-phosphate aminotransferase